MATIAAAYTGDWGLPGRVAAFILFVAVLSVYFLFSALLLLVLFLWPYLIASIVIWAGCKVLIWRSKKAKTEASSKGAQPGTN